MRRVTFSRNYTLSLSRTCQCYCKYCAFATHKAHIYAPGEVEKRLDEAERRNAKELLVLTGERPEVNPEVAAKLAEWGHDDFTSYVVWACERALERGILPHTNIGVLSHEDLARLREVTASQGLMLESASERLMDTVHAGSPTKHPAKRLATIEAAGELKIPFTSGILVGIGETDRERAEALFALRDAARRYGHLQEVIVQNFRAKPDTAMRDRPEPGVDELLAAVAVARVVLPTRVHLQAPPNLSPGHYPAILRAGIDDWGGVSPVTPDHVNPEMPWPHLDDLAARTAAGGH